MRFSTITDRKTRPGKIQKNTKNSNKILETLLFQTITNRFLIALFFLEIIIKNVYRINLNVNDSCNNMPHNVLDKQGKTGIGGIGKKEKMPAKCAVKVTGEL